MSKSILINFPTNFGDAVMALPVLDRLRASYPKAKITAVASSRTKDFLLRNNSLDEVVFFDKHWKLSQKIRFCLSLRKKFDLAADLKNSFLPVLLGIKQHTPFRRSQIKNSHVQKGFLKLIEKLAPKNQEVKKSDFSLTDQEKDKWKRFFLKPALFVACSSLAMPKRYPYRQLKQVVIKLSQEKFPIVIIGESKDREFYKDILSLPGVVDLVGKTNLAELVYLLKNSGRVILSVETGILHLGSYLDIPVVAIFGPGNVKKAHPWSSDYLVVTKDSLACAPCDTGKCLDDYACMEIKPEKVIKAIKQLW